MGVWRTVMLLAVLLGALIVGLGSWLAREQRWNGPLYCLQTPGQVWGVSPVPAGVKATCPASQTVRGEVRRGETRIEQYELPGWQPAPILAALQAGGFAVVSRIPDDGIQEAAILARDGQQVTYVADRFNGGTLVSVTARGAH